jgi:hypothetical protein
MKAPLVLALAGLSISTAQAAEGVLTLTCQGRTITKIGTGPSKEEPMSMGVIVNFTEIDKHHIACRRKTGDNDHASAAV